MNALFCSLSSKLNCKVVIKASNDPRSYRQDSTKLLKTGFKPKKSITHAIDELISAYNSNSLFDKDEWHTVRWMNLKNIS